MKLHIQTILLCSLTINLFAKSNTEMRSQIIGKWKITANQYDGEPLLPAWLSQIGEMEFKSDGNYYVWMQEQSDPDGKILSASAKWDIQDGKYVLKLNGSTEFAPLNLQIDSNEMILQQTKYESAQQHLKKSLPNMKGNEIEGLRLDYKFSFPIEWSVITPDMINQVSAEEQQSLEKLKCRALAVSPDENADISLFVSSRILSHEYLDLKTDFNIQSLGINEIKIGDTEWRIQKTRFMNIPFYGFNASTYHHNKTIQLIFRFHNDYEDPKSAFDLVLNSFSTGESKENPDLKYGKIMDHVCGEPLFIRFSNLDNTTDTMHALYSGSICPHCKEAWK